MQQNIRNNWTASGRELQPQLRAAFWPQTPSKHIRYSQRFMMSQKNAPLQKSKRLLVCFGRGIASLVLRLALAFALPKLALVGSWYWWQYWYNGLYWLNNEHSLFTSPWTGRLYAFCCPGPRKYRFALLDLHSNHELLYPPKNIFFARLLASQKFHALPGTMTGSTSASIKREATPPPSGKWREQYSTEGDENSLDDQLSEYRAGSHRPGQNDNKPPRIN